MMGGNSQYLGFSFTPYLLVEHKRAFLDSTLSWTQVQINGLGIQLVGKKGDSNWSSIAGLVYYF
jgi:hypothetical protein